MSLPKQALRPATLCIHAGTHCDERTGGACSPIYTSTACAFPNPANENFYPRYFNTPNQRVIERKVAALEKGEAAVVFGSGMAAITTLLFAHLKPGDHAVFQADLYGGTFEPWNAQVTPTRHKLGTLTLPAGRHTLRFECLRKAVQSEDAGFGVNRLTARVPVCVCAAPVDFRLVRQAQPWRGA